MVAADAYDAEDGESCMFATASNQPGLHLVHDDSDLTSVAFQDCLTELASQGVVRRLSQWLGENGLQVSKWFFTKDGTQRIQMHDTLVRPRCTLQPPPGLSLRECSTCQLLDRLVSNSWTLCEVPKHQDLQNREHRRGDSKISSSSRVARRFCGLTCYV